MNDLTLKLTADTPLQELTIVSEFPQYVELMQRAVTILLLSNLRTFYIDDQPLYEVLVKSNAVESSILKAALNSMGIALKSLLNSEDGGKLVDAVDISVEVVDRKQLITITLTTPTDNKVVGKLVL